MYPECEKMTAVKDRSQMIGEFLEWLEWEKNWEICERQSGDREYGHEQLVPVSFSTEKLLAEFFDIDLSKVEKEKIQMLNELRNKQGR